ncbi:MAG: hypothetical protein KF744_00390 [Taibaiella sp.]|nr:hypothetical protein [Taibaiella sp.]
MFDEILRVANMYEQGMERVKRRRDQWIDKYEMIRDHLKAMAQYLNENATYKQGFFVDTLHAFNEDIKGTSARMPSVTFRSGSMPMLVTFRNAMGEKKTYSEEGFSISFNPTITGEVVVLLQPHYSDLDKEMPPLVNLAVFPEPAELNVQVVDEIIAKGMEEAYYTSFTGMGAEQEQNQQPQQRTLIGFRRHDTTEKIS